MRLAAYDPAVLPAPPRQPKQSAGEVGLEMFFPSSSSQALWYDPLQVSEHVAEVVAQPPAMQDREMALSDLVAIVMAYTSSLASTTDGRPAASLGAFQFIVDNGVTPGAHRLENFVALCVDKASEDAARIVTVSAVFLAVEVALLAPLGALFLTSRLRGVARIRAGRVGVLLAVPPVVLKELAERRVPVGGHGEGDEGDPPPPEEVGARRDAVVMAIGKGVSPGDIMGEQAHCGPPCARPPHDAIAEGALQSCTPSALLTQRLGTASSKRRGRGRGWSWSAGRRGPSSSGQPPRGASSWGLWWLPGGSGTGTSTPDTLPRCRQRGSGLLF